MDKEKENTRDLLIDFVIESGYYYGDHKRKVAMVQDIVVDNFVIADLLEKWDRRRKNIRKLQANEFLNVTETSFDQDFYKLVRSIDEDMRVYEEAISTLINSHIL